MVYIVISELNGYKRVEDVFAKEENAWKFVDNMKANSRYELHDFYVCPYYVR